MMSDPAPAGYLQRILGLYFSASFARYVLCGGVSSMVNIAVRLAASQVMAFELAVAAAYGAGMVTAFILYRRFVFNDYSPLVRRQFLLFCAIYMAWFPLSWLMAVGLRALLMPVMPKQPAEFAAHVIAILVPVVANYAISKFLVFTGGRRPED